MLARMFDEMEDLRKSFDRFFEHFAGNQTQPTPSGEWSFIPPVETGWTDDHLNLRLVLPAVGEKDLDVSIQGNQLVVRGERKSPGNFGKEGYLWNRMAYGKFERVFDLPQGLNLEKLQANLHDGVLDISIPVTAEVKPRKIEISVGKEPKKIAA